MCIKRLNVIYNSCIRYVCNIRRRDHVSPYSSVIFGCTLVNYLKYRNCLFTYNLITTESPRYIFQGITKSSSSRTNYVTVLRPNGGYFRSSFYVYTASFWNALPISSLKNTNSLAIKNCLLHFADLI